MRIRLLAGVAGLAICAPMHPLAGQRVRGQVLHPDSATAAVGIIVVATDEKGAFLARALTSERGDFELALPGAGRYTVRALRIGYRPTILPALTLAEGETRTIRIVLGGAAVTLAPGRVRGGSARRSGYRPTILPALTLAEGETRTIRIVLGGAAVTLAPVRVRGESVCRIRQDSR